MSRALTSLGPHGIDRGEALCLQCRVVLGHDERCDLNPRHGVAPLASAAARTVLLADTSRRAAHERRGLVWVLVLAAILQALGFLAAAVLGSPGLILVGTLLALLILSLSPLFPPGRLRVVDPPLRLPPGRPRFSGFVVDGRITMSPLSGRRGAAYQIELRARRAAGGHVLMTRGWTEGLEVALGDGSILRVPAGRVRLVGPGRIRRPLEREEREELLLALARVAGEAPPAASATEMVLAFGDRIEVAVDADEAGFKELAVADGGPFRDGARAVRAARGVPVIRRR